LLGGTTNVCSISPVLLCLTVCLFSVCLNILVPSQVISSLCQALASLEVLNFTNNTMENDVVETPMLENIRIIVLNNCGVTWELVYPIAVTLKLLLLVIASHTVSSF
jgi:hypothetical protein